MVSLGYLRLLMFLPPILSPACNSFYSFLGLNNIPLCGCIPFRERVSDHADVLISSCVCTFHRAPMFLQPLGSVPPACLGAALSPGLVVPRLCAFGVEVPAEAVCHSWPSRVYSSPLLLSDQPGSLGTVRGAAALCALSRRHWSLHRLQPGLSFFS